MFHLHLHYYIYLLDFFVTTRIWCSLHHTRVHYVGTYVLAFHEYSYCQKVFRVPVRNPINIKYHHHAGKFFIDNSFKQFFFCIKVTPITRPHFTRTTCCLPSPPWQCWWCPWEPRCPRTTCSGTWWTLWRCRTSSFSSSSCSRWATSGGSSSPSYSFIWRSLVHRIIC